MSSTPANGSGHSTDESSVENTGISKEQDIPDKKNGTKAPAERVRDLWRVWLNDGWWPEVVDITLGCLMLVALCVVLAVYDGKAPPRFGSGVGAALTLNTVVAIITAAARAVFLIPIAECVSQLKWQWMSGGNRQLSDLSSFDKASRGINGGLGLLWTTKMKSIASMGALLMVYSFTVEPFSQQLLSVEYGLVPDPTLNATVEISSAITGISPQDGMITLGQTKNYGTTSLTLNMLGAIQYGLYNGNDTILPTVPSCSSGNCTFNSYLSLSVCGSVVDVTSHLNVRNVSIAGNSTHFKSVPQYYLSQDNYLTSYEGDYQVIANISSATSLQYANHSHSIGQEVLNRTNSIAFRNVSASIADAFIIVAQPGEAGGSGTYTAFEFALQWCVQNYSTTITNGSAVTNHLNAYYNFTKPPWENSTVSATPFGSKGANYSINSNTQYGLQAYLESLFNGTVYRGDDYLYTTSDSIRTLFQPFNVWATHPPDEVFTLINGVQGTNETGLQLTIDNVASSMTNYIRHWSRTGFAEGIIWHSQPHTVVRWGWIAAPAAFAATSIIFLLLTVLSQRLASQRSDTWKSSSLAVLHALEPALHRRLGGMGRPSAMEIRGSREAVRLVQTTDDGWRIVSTSDDIVPPHHDE